MFLKNIHLSDFKNYPGSTLDFSPVANVFIGKNGSGKTNLLEAIHYLSFTKGFAGTSDTQNIRHGCQHFSLHGELVSNGTTNQLGCQVHRGVKKVFLENGQEYQKLSAHIGKYPLVLIMPDDTDLVREGNELRRKFFDAMISQLDGDYLRDLIQYHHLLKQRNAMLRLFQEKKKVDGDLLEAYDHGLTPLGNVLFKKRGAFIQSFLPVFTEYFNFLVRGEEQTSVAYGSTLAEEDFGVGLKRSRSRDLLMGRTLVGIHRDQFNFHLEGQDLKVTGSQGQRKTFVMALKLAQWDILQKNKGFKPLLLLDDIFDKLDDYRIVRMLALIHRGVGQLFITDARPDRTQALLHQINVEASVFLIDRGTVENGKR